MGRPFCHEKCNGRFFLRKYELLTVENLIKHTLSLEVVNLKHEITTELFLKVLVLDIEKDGAELHSRVVSAGLDYLEQT